MPTAYKQEDVRCPACRRTGEVWKSEKKEATFTKQFFECDACGNEWMEKKLDGGLDEML